MVASPRSRAKLSVFRRALPRTKNGILPSSRSVDSTYLTAKRVFVFGDATHAIGIARVAAKELGFTLVGLVT